MAEELAEWRERYSINDLKLMCREIIEDRHSMACIGTGGLLCNMAAVRAGLFPIWGSDADEIMQLLWKDFTDTESIGDFTKSQPEMLRPPHVLHSTLPCENFTRPGDGSGGAGATGHLYAKQADWLVRLGAKIVILEMTNNAPMEFEEDVEALKSGLEKAYVIYDDALPTWIFGDGTFRYRYIIVGVHRDLGEAAKQFEWPAACYNEKRYPIAVDFAVPDELVPEKYLRKHTAPPKLNPHSEPQPGMLHHLGRYGEGIGHKSNPNNLLSWWGLFNTQLTSNGGGRRVMLNWRPGDEITTTRLTVPTETTDVASVTRTYTDWLHGLWSECAAMQRAYRDFDDFLRKCINMGVPLRFMCALDTAALRVLEKAGVAPDVPANRTVTETIKDAMEAQSYREANSRIRSAMADSGATGSLFFTDVEGHMIEAVPSQFTIAVAKDGESMPGSRDGKLPIIVLNRTRNASAPAKQKHVSEITSVKGLRTELYSLINAYKVLKYNIIFRQPDYEGGESEMFKPATASEEAQHLPFRFDWVGNGGWWLDYMLDNCGDAEKEDEHAALHAALLQRHSADEAEQNSIAQLAVATRNEYDLESGSALANKIAAHPDCKVIIQANDVGVVRVVTDSTPQDELDGTFQFQARHPHEVETRAVRMRLQHGKARQKDPEYHKGAAHLGCDRGDCWICTAVKGAMKRYYVKVDPYREHRPGYLFSMDGITMSHRSREGNKYLVQLRCYATGAIFKLCLYTRKDIIEELRQWITEKRADPHYRGYEGYDPDTGAMRGYEFCQFIHTDDPGEWGVKNRRWQSFQTEMRFKAIHKTPETSKELGHGEKSNCIIEHAVKAILMQENLPPDHWEVAAGDAEFMLLRHPTLATAEKAPIGGDRASPLEQITQARYSRHQIYRELSYHLQVGRLALVHLKDAKGSAMKAKVKYGIAWGMYREQVVFKSPFHAQTFRSKSFIGFEMHARANAYQLLGLPYKNNRKSLPLPGDDALKIDVHLSSPEDVAVWPRIPIVGVKVATDDKESNKETDSRFELGGSVRVYDLDGEQLSLDPENGELHRDGDSDKERVPLAASRSLAAGPRITQHGEGRALDNRAGRKPDDMSLVVPSSSKVNTLQHNTATAV